MSRLCKDYAKRSKVVRVRGTEPGERSVCFNRLAEISGGLFYSCTVKPHAIVCGIERDVSFVARRGLGKFTMVPMIDCEFFVRVEAGLSPPEFFLFKNLEPGHRAIRVLIERDPRSRLEERDNAKDQQSAL